MSEMYDGGGREPYPLSYAPVVDSPTPTVGAAAREGLARAWRAGDAGSVSPTGAFAFPGTREVDPREVFAGPGYTSPRPRVSRTARLAPVVALLGFAPGVSLVAIVLGVLGLQETADGRTAGRSAARAGIILGAMVSVLWLLVLAVWLVYN